MMERNSSKISGVMNVDNRPQCSRRQSRARKFTCEPRRELRLVSCGFSNTRFWSKGPLIAGTWAAKWRDAAHGSV